VETLLHVGLSNALAAAALALVAAAVGSVCRRPALAHGLWLLVLLKLVTPPLVPVRVPWPDAPEAAAPAGRSAEPPPAVLLLGPPARDVPEPGDAVREEAPPAVAPPAEEDLAEDDEDTAPAGPPGPSPAPAVAPGSWAEGLAVAWLAGSAGWFALAGLRLARFGRLLRHARPAPAEVRGLARGLAEQVGLSRCPGVWLLPGRVAPMLWAVGGKPCLLLPAELLEQVGAEAWTTLLLHELAHLRRRDHWVRGLEFVVMGLYWWHPVVWFARRELREAEEQCCDAWVVATLPGARRAYAAALLDTLDFLSADPPAVPPLASGLGQVTDLKRRLTMIMRGTTPRALGWPGCLAVLFLGGLLLPLLPTWVRAEPEEKGLTKELVGDDEPEGLPQKEDLKKAEDELRKLEADLRKKMAEIARARARAAAAQKLAAEKARAAFEMARTAKEAKAAGKGRAIRIEIIVQPEGKGVEIKDLVKKLQQALPSARVILRVDDELQAKEFQLWRGGGGGAGFAPKPPAPPNPGVGPLPRAGRAVPAPALPPGARLDGDRRMENLEKRLDIIQKQLDELRREMRRPGPGGGGVPPGGLPSAAPATPGADALPTPPRAPAVIAVPIQTQYFRVRPGDRPQP
jgi:beta-lactamase regulating signal transducer with metallopeptidase domain